MADKKSSTLDLLTAREAAWVIGMTEPGLAYKRKNGQGPEVHSEEPQLFYTGQSCFDYMRKQIDEMERELEKGRDRFVQIQEQRKPGD